VLAGALAAVLLAGGLAVASQSALPGDVLYPVKRATEWLRHVLAAGPEAEGRDHLRLARTRAEEVGALADRGRGGGADVPATLEAMDAQTRAGTGLLTTVAVQQARADPLAQLAGWTTDQQAVLRELLDRLPGPARERTQESLGLLRRVADRAATLQAQLSCSCLGATTVDDLGPRPCTPCAAVPGGPGSGPGSSSAPASPGPGGGGSSGSGAGSGRPSGPGSGSSSGSGGAGSSAGAGSPPAGGGLPLPTGGGGVPPPPTPGLPAPTLPSVPTLPVPTLPVPTLPVPSLPLPTTGLPLPT